MFGNYCVFLVNKCRNKSISPVTASDLRTELMLRMMKQYVSADFDTGYLNLVFGILFISALLN